MRDATRRCSSRAWVGAPFDVRSRLRLGGHACVPRLCESTEEDPVAAGGTGIQKQGASNGALVH